MRLPMPYVTPAARMAMPSWRSAERTRDRPVNTATVQPISSALTAPSTIDATTAPVPRAKNHGNSGMSAPTAKVTNDDAAACHGDPVFSG